MYIQYTYKSYYKKEYPNVSHGRIIPLLFLEQAVCKRGTKWEKDYILQLSVKVRDNVYTVQKKKKKKKKKEADEIETVFLRLLCDSLN